MARRTGRTEPGDLPLIQRYLLRELLQNAALTFAVITGIFLVGGSLSILHKAEVLTLGTFVRFVGYFVATNLDKTLPMTVLVASVMTYGRAAAENEINAMRASGIHLYHALAPALLFALAATAVVLYVNDQVAPHISGNKSEMLRKSLVDLVRTKIERGDNDIKLGDEAWLIWRDVNDKNEFLDLVYKRFDKKAGDGASPLKMEIHAERAVLTFDPKHDLILMTAWNVEYRFGDRLGESRVGLIENYAISPGPDSGKRKLSDHTLAELYSALPRRYDGAKSTRSIRVEFHQRIAGAFACVLFVLLGAPLSIIFRHGNRMVAFVIAFMIAMLGYYPLFILGEVLADQLKISPVYAVWSGTFGLGLLGVGLVWTVFRR